MTAPTGKRYVVFGGGLQGRVAAGDLAARPDTGQVVLADLRPPTDPLPRGVTSARVDALDGRQAEEAAREADACVLALPGEVARPALEHLVRAGARTADVSFVPDPPLDLDGEARERGAVVVTDCGIAPGLSHILAARMHRELGGLDTLRILVGGVPLEPPAGFRHAVYFNPRDLVAEYLRPARLREEGREAAPDPLETPAEPYDDPELGALESFVSDGLRSLLTSYPDVGTMVERTLRWPGHLELMRSLEAAGLLDETGPPEAPEPAADATARALAARFPGEKHPDALLMVVEGRNGNARASWRLLDRGRDGLTAMTRTTAFTTAAVAALLARGSFDTPGVHPPERLGREPVAEEVVRELAVRGVRAAPTGAPNGARRDAPLREP